MSREGQGTQLLDDAPGFTRQRPGGIFVVIQGPDRGEQVSLVGPSITFGSSESCEFSLTDKTVSRRHVEAFLAGTQTMLRDLGSTNGTYIHGARFNEVALPYGAEVRLGKTVIKFLPEEEAVLPDEAARASFGQLRGADSTMRRLFSLLGDVAPTEATVLIEGETGTGKELVAEELHNHSSRANGPFVVFDCGAVPHELLESALFGHVKGAFTGAERDRRGAFAEAHGGTLFLDEIGELELDLQPSLLRALDKRAVRRVGGSAYEKVDVRVVAATNRDLREEVARKAFREDLYYRLAVIRVQLPPLRQRRHDIDLLAQHFIERFGGGRTFAVGEAELGRLREHDWPGNVRELRNAIERACVLAKGQTLALDDARGGAAGGEASLGVRTDLPFKEAKGQLVERFEREYIEELMGRHRYNLSAAAREAQIDRKHLRELLRKYGLDPRGDRGDD